MNLKAENTLKMGEGSMKNSVITSAVLFVLIISTSSAPVLAAVTVESFINQDVYVTINFSGIDPITYTNIKANTQFNATTIPQIIMQNLAQKNVKRVGWGYARIDYNDNESLVHVAFHLGGSDIISFTVDKATTVRTYRVLTDWRKFKVDLTEGFSVDFDQHFSTLVSQWQRTNRTDSLGVHPTYHHETQLNQNSLRASFDFVLPVTATNVQAVEDTITYNVPPYAEDVFLNSPFLVLGAVIVIIIIVVAYRKARA